MSRAVKAATGASARDEVFSTTAARRSDFVFDQRVAAVFDDMLLRSVPFYKEQHAMLQELARHFFIPGTNIYDLGCSTGTALVHLGTAFRGQAGRIVGYDNSAPMLDRARATLAAHGLQDTVTVAQADLNEPFDIMQASVVTLCWTLQFIRPLQRATVLQRIHAGMVDGGALLITEKVLTDNTDMNRLFIERYYDYKRRNGYSEEEIAKKREALENVLVPYRIDENLALFRATGFVPATFFQWYNFVGFLCVKPPRG